MNHLLAGGCSAILILACHIAGAAALGEKVTSDSVQAKASQGSNLNMKVSNLKVLTAVKTSSLGASYSVRETVSDLRTLKEFLTSDGVVFAISWTGLSAPNFSEIFGSYYSEFKTARKLRPARSRRVLALQTSNLVVNSLNVGNTMSGIAYVPSLLPPGLIAEDLK